MLAGRGKLRFCGSRGSQKLLILPRRGMWHAPEPPPHPNVWRGRAPALALRRGRRSVALTPLVPVVSTASTVEGEPIRIPLFDLLDIGRASQTGAAAASSSLSVASIALPPPGFGAEPQYIHFEDSSHGLDAKIAVVLNQHGVYCKALMEDLAETVS